MTDAPLDVQVLVNLIAALASKLGGNVVVKQRDLNRVEGRQVLVQQRPNGSVRVKCFSRDGGRLERDGITARTEAGP